MRQFVHFSAVILILLTFLGYYPNFGIPPVKRSEAAAQAAEQRTEITYLSFSKPLALPHPGFLSTRFSSFHPGVDIATGLGMLIHPIIDGIVEKTGHDIFGLGNYVQISHENGFKSKYAHMGRIYVKAGQKVSAENTIGEVGLTGQTTGAHTHLEITLDDKFIDPVKLLPQMPDFPQERG